MNKCSYKKNYLNDPFYGKHFCGNIRKVLLVFSQQAASPERSHMAFTRVAHSPNHKPRLQGAGSPQPRREADLGLHGLREITTHFFSWVKAFCPSGPGTPSC